MSRTRDQILNLLETIQSVLDDTASYNKLNAESLSDIAKVQLSINDLIEDLLDEREEI